MRFFAAVSLFTLLTMAANAAGEPRKYAVINDGDNVEVTAIEIPPLEAPLDFFAPPSDEALSSTLTIKELADLYAGSFREEEKARILTMLSGKRPRSDTDIRALLHLYNRFPQNVRRTVQFSLRRLTPQDKYFEPFFIALLEEDSPAFQAFGLLGAFQIKSDEALPQIRGLASRTLYEPETPEQAAITLQALQVFGGLKAPGALKLLRRQARALPTVAEIIATYYWEEGLPSLTRWSESHKPENRARASAAWKADVATETLRTTIPQLRALVLDDRKSEFTRHRAALKLGFAADGAEVDRLLKDRAAAQDDKTRLYLTASLFASRHPKVIPLLVEHVKTHADPLHRAGALRELKDIMPAEGYRELLNWFAENDADKENRRISQIELRTLDRP